MAREEATLVTRGDGVGLSDRELLFHLRFHYDTSDVDGGEVKAVLAAQAVLPGRCDVRVNEADIVSSLKLWLQSEKALPYPRISLEIDGKDLLDPLSFSDFPFLADRDEADVVVLVQPATQSTQKHRQAASAQLDVPGHAAGRASTAAVPSLAIGRKSARSSFDKVYQRAEEEFAKPIAATVHLRTVSRVPSELTSAKIDVFPGETIGNVRVRLMDVFQVAWQYTALFITRPDQESESEMLTPLTFNDYAPLPSPLALVMDEETPDDDDGRADAAAGAGMAERLAALSLVPAKPLWYPVDGVATSYSDVYAREVRAFHTQVRVVASLSPSLASQPNIRTDEFPLHTQSCMGANVSMLRHDLRKRLAVSELEIDQVPRIRLVLYPGEVMLPPLSLSDYASIARNAFACITLELESA